MAGIAKEKSSKIGRQVPEHTANSNSRLQSQGLYHPFVEYQEQGLVGRYQSRSVSDQ